MTGKGMNPQPATRYRLLEPSGGSFSNPLVALRRIPSAESHGNGENDSFDDNEYGNYTLRYSSGPPSSTGEAASLESGLTSITVPNVDASVPPLNDRNILNVFAFLANTMLWYLAGVWGFDGLVPSNAEVSRHFQTLITPARWTFLIWGPIFFFEGIFVSVQLLPQFRSRLVVQGAVQYWFIQACLAQVTWTFLFAFRFIWLAFLFMAIVLASLGAILVSQYNNGRRYIGQSRREYWFMRFPFSLHMGWAIVMTLVNFSNIVVAHNASPSTQMAVAVVSLGLYLVTATFFLTALRKPDYVIPAVLAWALFGIAFQLHHPLDSTERFFGDTILSGIKASSVGTALVVLGLWVPRVAIAIFHRSCTIHIVQN